MHLMTRIVERAAANSVAVLTARTRYGNPAARALSRRLGFRPCVDAHGGAETRWQLDLGARRDGSKSSSGRTQDRSDERCIAA
jgi:hypothetical protein